MKRLSIENVSKTHDWLSENTAHWLPARADVGIVWSNRPHLLRKNFSETLGICSNDDITSNGDILQRF